MRILVKYDPADGDTLYATVESEDGDYVGMFMVHVTEEFAHRIMIFVTLKATMKKVKTEWKESGVPAGIMAEALEIIELLPVGIDEAARDYFINVPDEEAMEWLISFGTELLEAKMEKVDLRLAMARYAKIKNFVDTCQDEDVRKDLNSILESIPVDLDL